MKYNHAMAEREYKREWKAAKLERRKAGMQRKQIREAARAYRLEFNGERRFYRRTVPFPVSWTVKMKKKQKETQDILSYHTQAAG